MYLNFCPSKWAPIPQGKITGRQNSCRALLSEGERRNLEGKPARISLPSGRPRPSLEAASLCELHLSLTLTHKWCAWLKLGELQDCHLKSLSASSPLPPASFPQLKALCEGSHGYLFATRSWNAIVRGSRLPYWARSGWAGGHWSAAGSAAGFVTWGHSLLSSLRCGFCTFPRPGVLGLQWEGRQGIMYCSGYFLPTLAWPGLAVPAPAMFLPDARPSCVLVPCAGGSPVDKTSLPAFPSAGSCSQYHVFMG